MSDEFLFEENYAIHLFESHKNFVAILPSITEKFIFEVDCVFNRLVRKFFKRPA